MPPASNSHPPAILNRHETVTVRLLVILFAVFSLLPYGISWDYSGTSALNMEGSLTTKLQWGGLFLLSAVILYRHLPLVLRDLRVMNPFLLLLVLWCIGSSIWSPFPMITLKRAIQLGGVIMLGLAMQLAERPFEMFVKYLLHTLTAILLLSFFVVLLAPGIGIDYELGGAWRGALSQKNELGQVAALAVLLWQVRSYIEALTLTRLAAGLGFSLMMLAMSKSSTSILVTLMTSVLFHLFRKRRVASAYSLTRVAVALAMLITVLLFMFYMLESRMPTWDEISAPVAHLFGKGSDLTGRTDIWQLVGLEIQRHPWQGLGYGAFWLGPGSLSQYVIDALYWVPLQSHNGYLDILNEQGLTGLILAVLTLLFHARLLALIGRVDRLQAAFLGTTFLVVIITNFTESSLFRGVVFQNVYFMLTLVFASSTLRRLQARKSGPVAATLRKIPSSFPAKN